MPEARGMRRVALVTGASRGIGRAVALRLAREGARVFVNYRTDRLGADACVASIIRGGGEAQAVKADVSDPAAVRAMFRIVRNAARRLDVLVANAGVAPIERELSRVSAATWRRTFDTNALGAFLCAQAAAPLMEKGGGAMIFIGSVAARLGGSIGPHYAASKAALGGLAEWLGRSLAPRRIRVNIVEPGFVETDLSAAFYRSAAARRKVRAQVPLGRVGTTDEIAALVAFLAGPEASYVTRERIAIAGGR